MFSSKAPVLQFLCSILIIVLRYYCDIFPLCMYIVTNAGAMNTLQVTQNGILDEVRLTLSISHFNHDMMYSFRLLHISPSDVYHSIAIYTPLK